jgi:hypothetical protein
MCENKNDSNKSALCTKQFGRPPCVFYVSTIEIIMLHGHCPLFTVYEYKTEPLELL